MQLNSITINTLSNDFLDNYEFDGVCHIKSLPFFSVVQALEGSYDIQLGSGEERNTGTGGIFIAPSNIRQTITHHANPENGHMRARWIFLDATLNGRYPLDLVYSFPELVPESLTNSVSAAMDSVCLADNLCDRMSAVYQLIKLLLSMAEEKSARHIDEIASVLAYMEKNYRDHITVSQLAAMAYLSEPGLYSAFRAATGKTPIAYLNDYRLSHASLLLKTTGWSIKKIAAESGFDDALYFSRMFSRRYAMSPKAYRNQSEL